MSRSPERVSQASSALKIGTAATSRPLVELGRCFSALDSSANGPTISNAVNAASQRRCPLSARRCPPRIAAGSEQQRAERDPGADQHRHRDPAVRHLDQQIGDAPDHAHRGEQQPPAPAHQVSLGEQARPGLPVYSRVIRTGRSEPTLHAQAALAGGRRGDGFEVAADAARRGRGRRRGGRRRARRVRGRRRAWAPCRRSASSRRRSSRPDSALASRRSRRRRCRGCRWAPLPGRYRRRYGPVPCRYPVATGWPGRSVAGRL